MSITASNHSADAARYWGKSILEVLDDNRRRKTSTNMNDYEIRRLGYKDYGVFVKGRPSWARIIQRYACSHLEARRRWAMVLVTKRLRA